MDEDRIRLLASSETEVALSPTTRTRRLMHRLPLAAAAVLLFLAGPTTHAQVLDPGRQIEKGQIQITAAADGGAVEVPPDASNPSQDVPSSPSSNVQAPTSEVAIPGQVDRDRSLSGHTDLREIADLLFDQGFDPGEPGSLAMSTAIRDFEARAGLPQSGQPTARLLDALRATPTPTPWGAVAFGPQAKRFGMSWNLPTRHEALSQAKAHCRASDCSQVLSFYGTRCGALAASSMAYYISSRGDEDHARADALNRCEMQGATCRVIGSVCANGSAVAVRP